MSSTLTSYLTHRFERERRRREYELKWLEERFTPALNFLGRVSAVISNALNTQKGRKQVVEQIKDIVAGPSIENNAWCIATLLDPEETGLGDIVHSAMTYAHITESKEEFISYLARVQSSLRELAEEYRREREAIASGKPLESLIRERKRELEERVRRLGQAMGAVRAFVDREADIDSTLQDIEGSGVRGARLNWVLETLEAGGREQAKLEELRQACQERGWLSKELGKQG
jgi:DNA gyrase/topoisomerase IV subunit A